MKSNLLRILGLAAAAVSLGTLGLNLARADQQVSINYQMPIHVTCHVNETGCDNSPGPQITVDGEIALGGLQVQLVFKNNVKGTHQTVVTFSTNTVLIPLGEKIVIPKQPVLGGVGGNPHIWLQFYDPKTCKNLTDAIYLGRCVQGLTLDNEFLNQVIAATTIAADGCDNHPGPTITFGGGLKLSGLNARLIFSNNVKGTHVASATAEVCIVPNETPVQIPKQPVLGGSGGNPLIYIQFQHCDGDPIAPPLFLGRCNQI